MREHYVGLKDPKIAACNGRRTLLDEHSLGRHVKPNRACLACMSAALRDQPPVIAWMNTAGGAPP